MEADSLIVVSPGYKNYTAKINPEFQALIVELEPVVSEPA
jgi:hypothetical protein